MTSISTAPMAAARLPWLFGSNERDYWSFQCAGWGAFALVAVLSSSAGGWRNMLGMSIVKLSAVLAGLAQSHWWRGVLRRHDWPGRESGLSVSRIALTHVAHERVANGPYWAH